MVPQLGNIKVGSASNGLRGGYGYDQRGSDLSLRVYDPNASKDDSVALTINLDNPEATRQVRCGGTTVYSFLRTKCGFESRRGPWAASRTGPPSQRSPTTRWCAPRTPGPNRSPRIGDRVGPWETFEMHCQPGNRVALKSVANQKHVCAQERGGQAPDRQSRPGGPLGDVRHHRDLTPGRGWRRGLAWLATGRAYRPALRTSSTAYCVTNCPAPASPPRQDPSDSPGRLTHR